jgi:hypothetical protein
VLVAAGAAAEAGGLLGRQVLLGPGEFLEEDDDDLVVLAGDAGTTWDG